MEAPIRATLFSPAIMGKSRLQKSFASPSSSFPYRSLSIHLSIQSLCSASNSINIPTRSQLSTKTNKKTYGKICREYAKMARSKSLISELRRSLSEQSSSSANSNAAKVLSLTDKLCCFGTSRHFQREIRGYLHSVFREWNQSGGMMRDENDNIDVRSTALAFELLRVHGYPHVSPSVFGKAEFIRELNLKSVEGTRTAMIVLKASAIQFPGETILQNIHNFTAELLKSWISGTGNQAAQPRLTAEVKYWLENPWPWTPARWQARHLIDLYPSQPIHETTIIVETKILELAQLDFNLTQATHGEELRHLCRWWEGSHVADFNILRQRHVESYLHMAMTLFEPEYPDARIAIAMAATVLFVLDDVYDRCGTLPQLRLVTKDFREWAWDLRKQQDNSVSLPKEIRICLEFAMETLEQVFSWCSRKQNFDARRHLKTMWLQMVQSFETEAEWDEAEKHNQTQLPEMKEYLKNGCQSTGLLPLFAMAELLTCDCNSSDVFTSSKVWTFGQACAATVRILNDLYGSQMDHNIDQDSARKDRDCANYSEAVSVVTCLMKERPALRPEEAIGQLKEMADEPSRQVTFLYLQTDHGEGIWEKGHRMRLAWEITRTLQFFYRRIRTDGVKHIMRLILSQPVDEDSSHRTTEFVIT